MPLQVSYLIGSCLCKWWSMILARMFLQESCTFLALTSATARFLHHVSCKNPALILHLQVLLQDSCIKYLARILHLSCRFLACARFVQGYFLASILHLFRTFLVLEMYRDLARMMCTNLASFLRVQVTCKILQHTSCKTCSGFLTRRPRINPESLLQSYDFCHTSSCMN